jgi:hypothetical protein
MHTLHELRLVRLRPNSVQNRPAKVIELNVRREQRLERLQRLETKPTRPDAA